jgi:hypothetical protein
MKAERGNDTRALIFCTCHTHLRGVIIFDTLLLFSNNTGKFAWKHPHMTEL